MRTYGRDENGKWVLVETDENGFNDAVYLTSLAQVLKLALQESPFYAEDGVPAIGSVIQQILPTFHINRIQQKFAKHFTSLQITLEQADPPVYNIAALTKLGSSIIYKVYS